MGFSVVGCQWECVCACVCGMGAILVLEKGRLTINLTFFCRQRYLLPDILWIISDETKALWLSTSSHMLVFTVSQHSVLLGARMIVC